jgi:undecaprenyl diphosphate synthase
MQSHSALSVLPLPEPAPRALHVAIISDGNGRWASSRGLPRSEGHRAGVEAARRAIEVAPQLGIGTLTLFALSSANWQRPPAEVNAILRLLHEYLLTETSRCVSAGVRVSIMGRRDRIPLALRNTIANTEAATAGGTRLRLRLALDYSSREAIYRAACRFYKVTRVSLEAFGEVLQEINRDDAPDVDLLIRTGGEQRLSDFLLWECAYAELYFLEKRWPDFEAADLVRAVTEYHRRVRTMGCLPERQTLHAAASAKTFDGALSGAAGGAPPL